MGMGIITAIVPQKKNKGRLNILVDGVFACGLAEETAAPLRVGQSLSDQDMAALQAADGVAQAKQKAFRFLSYRPRSVAEVRRNLAGKGIDDSVINQVIDYLLEQQLLDDHAFARYWVEQRETFKPRSQFALGQELQQKGVAQEVISELLAELDESEMARQAALPKVRLWASLPREQFSRKMGAFLQRRGFSYSVIAPVIAEMWALAADERVIS
jgi:regulatory protein